MANVVEASELVEVVDMLVNEVSKIKPDSSEVIAVAEIAAEGEQIIVKDDVEEKKQNTEKHDDDIGSGAIAGDEYRPVTDVEANKADEDKDKLLQTCVEADAKKDVKVEEKDDVKHGNEGREDVKKEDKVCDNEGKAEGKVQVKDDAEGELDHGVEDDDDDVEEEEEDENEGGNTGEKVEKPLDDDQDRRNPQYIPKGGAFYEHDNRTSLEDVENKDPQENEKKKKSWKESKESERWLHDCYNESEQKAKSTAEIIEAYGYDIRSEDAPPRARRRRKYGRGPDKYERSWEDEQAYLVKQNNIGRRGKKKPFGKDEFPPLPNQKSNSTVTKPVHKPVSRKKEEVSDKSKNGKMNGNEKPPAVMHASRSSHSGNHSNLPGFHSDKKNFNQMSKKMNDDDIKPFRNDGNKWRNNFKQGKQEDVPRPIKTQSIRHTDPPFRRSVDTSKHTVKESDLSHVTDGISQMTFQTRQMNMRDLRSKTINGPEEKINEPEMDSPANRQNPKRYSKIRKGYTGIFPPEEVPELDQTEIHKMQQEQQKSQHLNLTQPLNMQNVMKRYAGTYDFVPGNTSYLGGRPIISGIPQQAMSPQGIHQQTLSPQGIPQQALSPQVTGLQTIELQQNPLAQPNFVPQPMYIDMDAHYPSDIMGPFSSYPPYSGNQTGDVYQPSRGITYYSTECQSSGQKRPPPPRRQKAAIPIIPPSE